MKPWRLLFGFISLSTGIVRCSAIGLEELDIALKSYDKRVRPYQNVAPVEVEVQIAIKALGPIDTKTFTFEADFYLREFWTDPRISLEIENTIHLPGNPTSFLWVPDLFIQNAGKTKIHKMVTESTGTLIQSGGRIMLSSAIKVSFACSMDLHIYPMDSQICSLELESYLFSNRNLNPVWRDKPLEYDEKSIKVPGFTVRNITTDVYNHTYLTNPVFPRLRVSFHIDRTLTYYLYRTYIPSISLVILSWGTFHLPATAYPARMAVIVSNFLASTYILQHASSEYTKVEYTTSIEIYLLVNMCFILITMLEYMIVLRTPPDIDIPRKKLSRKEEDTKKNNIEMVKSFYCNKNAIEDKEDIDYVSNDTHGQVEVISAKEKDTRKVQNLHNIDRISTVLIPLAYIIFNITFFAYFLPKGKMY